MFSKTSLVAVAGVITALMSTAAVVSGAAPIAAQNVSKTTIAASTAPPTVPPVTVAPVTVPPVTVASTTPLSALPVTTVPAGATRLTDRTARVTVLVPNTWTDVSVTPAMRNDGGDRPRIVAAPDITAMWETWATPGVWINALPASVDPAGWLAEYIFTNSCTRGALEPVNDGRFIGSKQTWLNCGGGAAQIVQFAARSADNTYGIYIQLQIVTPDDPAVAMVLGSIGLVPGATLTTPTTVPAGPVTTVGPADPTLISAAVPADAIRLVDDTGALSLSVPATFAETQTWPDTNDDGTNRPTIDAAPGMDAFFDEWSAPGLSALLLPPVDAATLLANRDQPGCDDGGTRPFANANYTGLIQTWTNCGDTPARVIQVAISPADNSGTILMYVQLPDADNTALAVALASVQIL